MTFYLSPFTIRWGALSDNGTSSGAMAMVMKNEVEFTLGMYTITYLRSKFMTSSMFYYTVPYILIVPPGVPLSPFEKLFRPFQMPVWILLLLTFSAAACVVTAVKFQSAHIRNFVFGTKNKSPYLNIFNVFVGGSLALLPKRNFARSLLMFFMLFSIVKRTLYQGALFQFLQADDRNKEVQSIDEIVERNFKVYVMPNQLEHTQHLKFRQQRVVVNSTIVEEKKMETMNPYSRSAVTTSIEQVLYYNKMNYRNMNTFTVCKEQLFTFQYGIYFRKNSYLAEIFSDKISIFKESGLIDFWASDYISSKYLNIKLPSELPRQLNIEQLMGGFDVLVIGFIIGVLILLLELASTYFRIRKLQSFIEFFT